MGGGGKWPEKQSGMKTEVGEVEREDGKAEREKM
jgi:hypothetical protein